MKSDHTGLTQANRPPRNPVRFKRGLVDEAILGKCRIAAERQMGLAVAHEDLLGRIMASEAGSLDGMAAAWQDLWRLAHMTIHLRSGVEALRTSDAVVDIKTAASSAARLRRRLRKALTAYARAALRDKEPKEQSIVTAREAALAEIGTRGAAEAERLADIEASADPAQTVLRQGVTKPLLDLALDWHRTESKTT
jgi:hypothetical protein